MCPDPLFPWLSEVLDSVPGMGGGGVISMPQVSSCHLYLLSICNLSFVNRKRNETF